MRHSIEYRLSQGLRLDQVYRLWAGRGTVKVVESLPASVDLTVYLRQGEKLGPGISGSDGRRWTGRFAGFTESHLGTIDGSTGTFR